MKYLLSRASRPVLARLSKERILCAFDFDGTLAPIVEHPDKARMSQRTRKLLGRVAAAYPCLILSGRSRTDLLGKLDGIGIQRVIGNHGAETGRPEKRARRQVKSWKTALEPEIGALPGVWIEDKGLSLAVHYRQSRRKAEARRRILEAVRGLRQVRLVGGKQVVNLVLEGAPGKGQALAAERERVRCTWVLFVGDDENDEDGFALDGNIIAVRVGKKRQSHAGYYVRSQAEVDQLLSLLATLRASTCPVIRIKG